MNKIGTIIALALLLGAGGYVAKLKWDNATLRKQRNELALETANREAEAATQYTLVRDSLRATARLATQYEQEADSLSRELGVERERASADVVATVDTAVGSDTGSVSGDDVLHFKIRRTPFSATFAVTVTPPSVDYAIVLDPALLRITVGCRQETDEIADRALIAIRGPVWLDIDLVDTNVDPSVCNTKLMERPPRGFAGQLAGPAIGAVVGAGMAAIYGDPADVGANVISGALLGGAAGFLIDQLLK